MLHHIWSNMFSKICTRDFAYGSNRLGKSSFCCFLLRIKYCQMECFFAQTYTYHWLCIICILKTNLAEDQPNRFLIRYVFVIVEVMSDILIYTSGICV